MLTTRVRSRALLAGITALLLLLPAAGPIVAQDAPAPSAAPALVDPATEGAALATRFLEILGLPDAEKASELEGFLAAEFQLVRATGDRLDKSSYVANPASVEEFRISDVVATQSDDVVVVSYLLATTETLEGMAQTTTAPRLSVFHWDGAGWRLAAHSNFGAIGTEPAASAEPSATPAG